MIPKTDKYSRLSEERRRLTDLIYIDEADFLRRQGRVAYIDRELAKLARRAESNRNYREMMYDLNGHHGRA